MSIILLFNTSNSKTRENSVPKNKKMAPLRSGHQPVIASEEAASHLYSELTTQFSTLETEARLAFESNSTNATALATKILATKQMLLEKCQMLKDISQGELAKRSDWLLIKAIAFYSHLDFLTNKNKEEVFKHLQLSLKSIESLKEPHLTNEEQKKEFAETERYKFLTLAHLFDHYCQKDPLSIKEFNQFLLTFKNNLIKLNNPALIIQGYIASSALRQGSIPAQQRPIDLYEAEVLCYEASKVWDTITDQLLSRSALKQLIHVQLLIVKQSKTFLNIFRANRKNLDAFKEKLKTENSVSNFIQLNTLKNLYQVVQKEIIDFLKEIKNKQPDFLEKTELYWKGIWNVTTLVKWVDHGFENALDFWQRRIDELSTPIYAHIEEHKHDVRKMKIMISNANSDWFKAIALLEDEKNIAQAKLLTIQVRKGLINQADILASLEDKEKKLEQKIKQLYAKLDELNKIKAEIIKTAEKNLDDLLMEELKRDYLEKETALADSDKTASSIVSPPLSVEISNDNTQDTPQLPRDLLKEAYGFFRKKDYLSAIKAYKQFQQLPEYRQDILNPVKCLLGIGDCLTANAKEEAKKGNDQLRMFYEQQAKSEYQKALGMIEDLCATVDKTSPLYEALLTYRYFFRESLSLPDEESIERIYVKPSFVEENLLKKPEKTKKSGIKSVKPELKKYHHYLAMPEPVTYIFSALKNHRKSGNKKKQTYLTGGAVRDLLLGKTPSDYDGVTEFSQEEIATILSDLTYQGQKVKFYQVKGKHPITNIEIDGHLIQLSSFHTNPADEANPKYENDAALIDVLQRDITINALLYDLDTNQILDWVNGYEDLNSGIIRPVLSIERMLEDPVRLLRVLRFAEKLQFELDKTILDFLKAGKLANGQDLNVFRTVNAGSLYYHVTKTFFSGCAVNLYRQLKDYGLLNVIFPCVSEYLHRKNDPTFSYFIEMILDSIDNRINANKPVSQALFFAGLLWGPFYEQFQQRLQLNDANDVVTSERIFKETVTEFLQKQSECMLIPSAIQGRVSSLWQMHLGQKGLVPVSTIPTISEKIVYKTFAFFLGQAEAQAKQKVAYAAYYQNNQKDVARKTTQLLAPEPSMTDSIRAAI